METAPGYAGPLYLGLSGLGLLVSRAKDSASSFVTSDRAGIAITTFPFLRSYSEKFSARILKGTFNRMSAKPFQIMIFSRSCS